MGKMKDLALDIQEEILHGFLSFQEIATKYHVPVSWVDEVAKELATMGHPEPTMDYIIENDYQDEF